MKRRTTDEARVDALNEQDERLLNALFDGEINRDEFTKRVGAPSRVEQELDGLRALRREIRSWHADRIQDSEGKPLKIDIWEQIKGRVEEQTKGARSSAGFDIRGAIARFLEGDWFGRPVSFGGVYTGGAFAAATLLGLALYSAGGGGSEAGFTDQLATSSRLPVAQTSAPEVITVARNEESAFSGPATFSDGGSDSSRDQLIGVLGDEPPADVLAMMNESEEEGRRRFVPPLPESLKVRLLSPQMVAGATAVGLRTSSGADIDWIKSSKPFKIVAAQGHSAPPVIWVASKKGR